jgi:Cof subfamily protein (haloacid dehalogenase superfamily)
MNYKIIALDVDGTLLNDNYEITERTKFAVRKAHEAGAQIVLCTGRAAQSTIPLLTELGLEGVVITHNGAATVQSHNNKVIHQVAFSAESITPFIVYCRKHHIHFSLCSPLEQFVEELDAAAEAMYKNFMLKPFVVEDACILDIPMVKLSVFGEQNVMEQFETDWLTLENPLNVIRSGPRFIDIMHPEATKGHALRRFAEDAGVRPEHILAIGNYYNDLEMLQYAGLGIAMDNSPEPLKLLTDKTTGSNNADGVYQAIMLHCFE